MSEGGTAWIPCSERLPENFKTVLVYDKIDGEAFTGRYCKCGKYSGWMINGFEMQEIQDYGFCFTHWMPLPEPPEVEK